ncbi:hypothetical protein FA95DRAFT_614592 [Auriscalpium vulgare]|uniref:Uncharacterized protein n=1 Tax=Auriscalpium vulgare TaxID=40419 RepID=A0ACB8RD49_9AGAM|nr:hypothetical protein FA95DRAFT_614592 [Auriscalpium vulgare]
MSSYFPDPRNYTQEPQQDGSPPPESGVPHYGTPAYRNAPPYPPTDNNAGNRYMTMPVAQPFLGNAAPSPYGYPPPSAPQHGGPYVQDASRSYTMPSTGQYGAPSPFYSPLTSPLAGQAYPSAPGHDMRYQQQPSYSSAATVPSVGYGTQSNGATSIGAGNATYRASRAPHSGAGMGNMSKTSKPVSVPCKMPNCTQVVPEGMVPLGIEYCGDRHRREAVQAGLARACSTCGLRAQANDGSGFCGRSCRPH